MNYRKKIIFPGRFQPFHKEHYERIKETINYVKRKYSNYTLPNYEKGEDIVFLVYNPNEGKRSYYNPLTQEEQKEIILDYFPLSTVIFLDKGVKALYSLIKIKNLYNEHVLITKFKKKSLLYKILGFHIYQPKGKKRINASNIRESLYKSLKDGKKFEFSEYINEKTKNFLINAFQEMNEIDKNPNFKNFCRFYFFKKYF